MRNTALKHILTLAICIFIYSHIFSDNIKYRYVCNDLNIPSIRGNVKIQDIYNDHAFNGDGIEIIVFGFDEISFRLFIDGIDSCYECYGIIKDEIKINILNNCIGNKIGFRFIDFYRKVNDDGIRWFFNNRSPVDYGNSESRRLQNFSFGLIDMDTCELYYYRYDS